MILPIIAYGDPILKKKAQEITPEHPKLKELIASMYETMYNSSGVGLAAPQIGVSIRLFIVDCSPFDDDEKAKDFKRTFINPQVTLEEGEKWNFNEGCLSIPGIREDINRHPKVYISYYDENFVHHEDIFDGIIARVIQHEYDHLEGTLFIDRLSAFKRTLLKNRLLDITKGKVDVDYRMKFPAKR